MTDVHDNGHPAVAGPDRDVLLLKVPQDTSFDHPLDEDAPPAVPVHADDGNELPDLGGERRPVVPEHLRTPAGIARTAGKYLDAGLFHGSFHLLRVPMYLVLGVVYAVAGLIRVGNAQRKWWWVTEHSYLASKAVVDGNSPEWRSLHNLVRKTRSWRGTCLAAELVAAGGVIAAAASWPPWGLITLGCAAIPLLAVKGQPEGRPLVQSAVTTPLVRRVNTDVIIRAYEAAGLCSTDPAKPGQALGFGSVMSRDALDKASQVVIHLPFGGTFAKVINAKPQIASGLDVAESQVYFSPDRQSERRHTLRVLDTDPLAEPAGRTPLLDCRQRSVWRKAPLGLDQFGRKVALHLMWISLLIGAQPRRGKTFTARELALFCALDPYVDITLIDGKSSKDWQPLRYVAKRFIQGTYPTADGNPVERAMDALREIDRHIVHVNSELEKLPVSECPEGKLTELLYRRQDLHVQLLIMEEFQCYFELEDQKKNKEFAWLLSRIGSMGPSAGVILMSASQKPAGVGAGDVQRLFNRFRDNHTIRFALRCGNRDVSMAILGSESYSEGYDASKLPLGEQYRGVGILYGVTDDAPTVRTYLADGRDSEVICLAARKLRERAHTLSGDAAGSAPDEPDSDIVADLLAVLGADSGLWWETAAERLAAEFPMRHADATAESVSAAARARGVPSADVRWPPGRSGTNRKGCRKADLDSAARP